MLRGHLFGSYRATSKASKGLATCLTIESFKTSFFRFLANDWQYLSYSSIIKDHEVYLAYEETCVKFSEHDKLVLTEEMPAYVCSHDEADTRLIFHLGNVLQDDPSHKMSVRSNDTDVMILLLYHTLHFQVTPLVWMDAGLSGKTPEGI